MPWAIPAPPITDARIDAALTEQTAAKKVNPRTAAEITAGKTPSDYRERAGGVRRLGAVCDGATSDATAVNDTDAVGGEIRFPAGLSCKYDAATTLVNIDNVVLEKGADIVGLGDDSSIVSTDKRGAFVGLHHNYTERKKAEGSPMTAITTGLFQTPPISDAVGGPLDVLAWWYQDFGIEWTRIGNSANGNVKWYTWEWNHTDTVETDGYKQDRQPLQGWYRGDDANVLDWQCFWLRESGVTAVGLLGQNNDYANWSTATDRLHWMYQLFNNTPNFKGLKYVLPIVYSAPVTGSHTGAANASVLTDSAASFGATDSLVGRRVTNNTDGSSGEITANTGTTVTATLAGGTENDWDSADTYTIDHAYSPSDGGVTSTQNLKDEFDNSVTSILGSFDNAYTIERDGKAYVCFSIWDSGQLRTITDNASGATNLKAFFAYVAGEMKTLGYDGAAFLTRNASTTVTLKNEDGFDDDWIYIWSDYSRVFGEDHATQTTYQEIVDDFAAAVPANFEIMVPSIVTSRDSHSAHPSSFNEVGHTPAKFEQLVRKAANYVESNRDLCPNLITVYNVSEWAEGGPGLIPNMQDKFGYLDALRRGIAGGGARIRHGSGVFEATLTGCTTSPTGNVRYTVDHESGQVSLQFPQILATSNATTATLTGMPANIRPKTAQALQQAIVRDNGSDSVATAYIAVTGVITLNKNVLSAFTAAGSKGMRPCTVIYNFRD